MQAKVFLAQGFKCGNACFHWLRQPVGPLWFGGSQTGLDDDMLHGRDCRTAAAADIEQELGKQPFGRQVRS